VGQGLADNLGAKVGDTVVMVANTRSGSINALEATIRGTFATMSKAYDDAALRAPLPMAQELLRISGAHKWVVFLNRTETTQATVRALEQQLAGKDLRILPWYDLADFYSKTVALYSKQVGMMKLIIAVIIVLSVSNTLTTTIMERTGEIGTAMALGVPRIRLLSRFVCEGMLIGVVGGLVGVVVGYVLAKVISTIGIPMPPPPGMARGYTGRILVTPGLAFDAVSLAFITTLLASIYPAWKASRMAIVDALRSNR
jgi:putative ABC transport system permease protein